MNILLYEWNTFGQRDLEDSLGRLGHKVDKIKYVFTDFEKDEAFERKLSDLFLMKRYDFVISFNYFQVISKVCNSFCIKYIAWVWDSPLINLNSRTVYNPVNYIFIFDGVLYQQMKYELKADTVYYLPLAVNVERLDKLITSLEDAERYHSEVSFVGNLYDKRNHFDEIANLSDYLAGYFDGIMRAQMKIYGYNFIKEMLTEHVMEELSRYIDICPGSNFVGDIRDIFADRFLNAKITGMERRQLLGSLSGHYEVTLYTDSDSSELKKVRNRGYIDYYNVMPKVFRYSKINLNMTVRTIKSGIPLRVFDILGAGGFLITNYQADIADYFTIGEDLVCYESEEDLIAKVGYYLEHEEERKQIALNGYRKVRQYHNYDLRLKEMLHIASGELTVEGLQRDPVYPTEGKDIEGFRLELLELVWDDRLEEAKTEYYNYRRKYPEALSEPWFADLDMVFQIQAYEKIRGQRTLFDHSRDLMKVMEHYDRLKQVVLCLEDGIHEDTVMDELGQDLTEEEQALVCYTEDNQVSYTAMVFIIGNDAGNRVALLNRVAISFLKAGKNDMILPFLSEAIELAPKDDTTLYHLALALYQMGEYKLAYDYINDITIAPPGALKLMENILRYI